jgi:adenosylcobinamide-phosphate synthase
MNEIVVFAGAYMLDILMGDPVWLPHPVRLIGLLISRLEALLRGISSEKSAGLIMTFLVAGSIFCIFYAIDKALSLHPSALSYLILIYLTSTTIATNGLLKAGRGIIRALEDGEIIMARQRLSEIVGRDTGVLDEKGILRATIESMAENTSDGIIAPMFYYAIGGLPLAMTYKAINTLDSMVGYRDERYRRFGWASARLDDIANFLPARITGVLIVFSVLVIKILKDPTHALRITHHASRIMLHDGRRHPSPNSGIPESAMAGALGIRLGGPAYYNGVLVEKPFIGDEVSISEDLYMNSARGVMIITLITSFTGFLFTSLILYWRSLL